MILVLQARSIQICFGGLGGRFQIIQKWKEEREGRGREEERREKNLFQICRKSKNKHKFYIFKSLDHSFI